MKDGFAGEAAAIGLVAHDPVNLGGDDDGLTAGTALEETPKHLFAGAAGVDVGGVEEVDSQIERLAQERLAVLLVEAPGMASRLGFAGSGRAIGHAAEANARDFEAGLAQICIVHFPLSDSAANDVIRLNIMVRMRPMTRGIGG